MIRAIFLDFDGTLFSHQSHQIPPSTYEAISQLHAKGIKVFLCTGRSRSELAAFDLELLKVDGMILSNGQMIYDENDTLIFEQEIDGILKDKLVKIFNDKKIPIYFGNEDELFLNFSNEQFVAVQEGVSSPVPEIREYRGEKITMASAIIPPAEVENLLNDLKPYAEMTFWFDGAIDILPKGTSKTTGIARVLKLYGIDAGETMAFGDGENDLGMLKMCQIGIAMGNAIDLLKENADYVTTDIDDDGIYNALKHFELI